MSENKTPIYLTDEEIEVFKWCWRNYPVFKKAMKVLRPGRLILNLNSSAEVGDNFEFQIPKNRKFVEST